MAVEYDIKVTENKDLQEQVSIRIINPLQILQITKMLYKKIEENQILQQKLDEANKA